MDPRTLQLIQRGLIAAVTVVLALVVVIAFIRVLQSSEQSTAIRTTTSTTTVTQPGDTTTTTSSSNGTTTTTSGAVAPAVCADEEPTDGNVTVLRVYYPCGSNTLASGQVWVYRAVAPTDLVLTTTMNEMVKGVDDEEAALGYRSPFPDTATGSFLGATIDRDEAKAFLEFTSDVFPDGVDTPEGAQVFLSTLNANVFQFSTINQVEYRLGGSCDAFWQQLGASCEVITRSEWQASLNTG
jgi:hypothetical protein